jgi:hypothetical protein
MSASIAADECERLHLMSNCTSPQDQQSSTSVSIILRKVFRPVPPRPAGFFRFRYSTAVSGSTFALFGFLPRLAG